MRCQTDNVTLRFRLGLTCQLATRHGSCVDAVDRPLQGQMMSGTLSVTDYYVTASEVVIGGRRLLQKLCSKATSVLFKKTSNLYIRRLAYKHVLSLLFIDRVSCILKAISSENMNKSSTRST